MVKEHQICSIGDKETRHDDCAHFKQIKYELYRSGPNHQVHSRLQEVYQSQSPDTKSKKLSPKKQEQIRVVHHECHFEELDCGQQQTHTEYFYSVALKNFKAPPLVYFCVHYAVECKQEAK